MLAPADPGVLIGEIPIDPFVLFLLPPLLSDLAWVTVAVVGVVGMVVVVLPRLLRRRDPAVIDIIDGACTGCELCVADCSVRRHPHGRFGSRVWPPEGRRPAIGIGVWPS